MTATPESRVFVLDTNVLMHDPTALFRFDEHDVYLPMMVLEEIDAGKKGMTEAARNARQFSRFIDDLIQDLDKNDIDAGIPLGDPFAGANGKPRQSGRLFFETTSSPSALPQTLPGQSPDNLILSCTLSLRAARPDQRVTLVSKDVNLRIKATVVGIHAEDYFNDKTLNDVDLLYTGSRDLPEDFWDHHGKDMESWQENGRTFYRIKGPSVADWTPNEFVCDSNDTSFDAIVRRVDADGAVIELVQDFIQEKHSVWGICARNREQNYALNLIMDPQVDFVTILGVAGTGKTLLTLAGGLVQTLDDNRYKEIIMTRVTVPLGEDIGFLPGTEEEKMEPWMGALMDNLEVLTRNEHGGAWGRAATNDLLRNRIKIRSMNFMRGRTFVDRFLILDEAQNLTAKQMKAIITRAGPGTKLVCIGNVSQIDTPYLTETTSGLTYVVNRFKSWDHSGHITLLRGERSRLADYASDIL
ncbi:MAG: PhoH family protein [Gammaproteobacteria bacterium]